MGKFGANNLGTEGAAMYAVERIGEELKPVSRVPYVPEAEVALLRAQPVEEHPHGFSPISPATSTPTTPVEDMANARRDANSSGKVSPVYSQASNSEPQSPAESWDPSVSTTTSVHSRYVLSGFVP